MKEQNQKKNIWIFHHYATPPTLNGLSRPYYFGKQLKEHGYDTTVFSASYLHFADYNLLDDKDKRPFLLNEESEVPFVFVKTPSYANNGKKRILNMIAFYRHLFKVTKLYMQTREKPDVIIASSPHPLTMIAGIKIAKKLGIPCICEIRDFWPEVFFTGGRLQEKSTIGKMLISGEKWIYEHADALVFLKEGDSTYITDHKWDKNQGGNIDMEKCFYINNGVDLEAFNHNKKENVLNDPDLQDGEKFTVVYTGAIRSVNNVGILLDAAARLQHMEQIQFLIYGDGNEKAMLERRIQDEGLENVKMKGYADKQYIPYILSQSSLNILNYSQSQYNWSRGNSSNKLFEYMASGRPVISTVKMGYSQIEKYECGLSLDEDTPEQLADAILTIYQMSPESYKQMGQNAANGAKDFNYPKLTNRLIRVIENIR